MADGSVLALVRTIGEMGHVNADGRQLQVWSLEEIGNLITAWPEAVQQAKRLFPGVVATPSVRTPSTLDDPLDVLDDGSRPDGRDIVPGRPTGDEPAPSDIDGW